MSEVKKRELYHGFCRPGYEKVSGYWRDKGGYVKEHCRKITVQGRRKALTSGLFNEAMIAQEDARLGFDSLTDSTRAGERNANRMERRAEKLKQVMKEQEERKEEIRRKEDE